MWARLRQVSTAGKTAARVQNPFSGARVAIVRARWNDEITRALAQGAVQAALAEGARVEEFEVAGSFELPPAVAMIARSGRFDAVVPLGCLIRGETAHFDVLAHAVARSLAELAVSALPVAIPFGVLTCESIDQARARSSPEHNVGAEAMEAALELVSLRHAMASSAARASRSASTARSRPIRAKRSRSPGSR
jgi:6,7-dimethyl-8-ribityllumazine synthase